MSMFISNDVLLMDSNFNIKVYSKQWAFKLTLITSKMDTVINFENSKNNGLWEFVFNYYIPVSNEVMTHSDLIKIYKEWALIYTGYITNTIAKMNSNWEYRAISCMGIQSKLAWKYYTQWDDYKFTRTKDPADFVREIFGQQNKESHDLTDWLAYYRDWESGDVYDVVNDTTISWTITDATKAPWIVWDCYEFENWLASESNGTAEVKLASTIVVPTHTWATVSFWAYVRWFSNWYTWSYAYKNWFSWVYKHDSSTENFFSFRANGLRLEADDNSVRFVNTDIELNAWHHYTVTFTDTEIRWYVDGKLVWTSPACTQSTKIHTIGKWYGTTSLDWMLDEMWFWNRALKESEAELLYNKRRWTTYPFENTGLFSWGDDIDLKEWLVHYWDFQEWVDWVVWWSVWVLGWSPTWFMAEWKIWQWYDNDWWHSEVINYWNIDIPTGNQTVAFWIRPTRKNWAREESFWEKSYWWEWALRTTTAGAVVYYYGTAWSNAAPYEAVWSWSFTLDADTRYHIATVRDFDNGKLTLYIDWEIIWQVDTTFSFATASTANFLIWNWYKSNTSWKFDEFGIRSRALSQNEIRKLYSDWWWASYPFESIQNTYQDASLEFDANKRSDALTRVLQSTSSVFSLRNGWDVFFKTPASHTEHVLTLGNEITNIDWETKSDTLVNKVTVVYSGGQVVVEDNESQAKYGVKEFYNTDDRIKNQETALAKANEVLSKQSQPLWNIRLTINDTYDLESLNPWDTVSVRNTEYVIENKVIEKVIYWYDTVELYLDDYRSIERSLSVNAQNSVEWQLAWKVSTTGDEDISWDKTFTGTLKSQFLQYEHSINLWSWYDLNNLVTSWFYDWNVLVNRPAEATASWGYVVHQRHSNDANSVWKMQVYTELTRNWESWYRYWRTTHSWTRQPRKRIAEDSELVHTTGNESISWVKTFLSNMVISSAAPVLQMNEAGIKNWYWVVDWASMNIREDWLSWSNIKWSIAPWWDITQEGTINWQEIWDSGWITPTMANWWVVYSASRATPQYRRIWDVVHIKGMIKNGTAGTIFTLPVWYRPAKYRMIDTKWNWYATVRMDIRPTWLVVMYWYATWWNTIECSFAI